MTAEVDQIVGALDALLDHQAELREARRERSRKVSVSQTIDAMLAGEVARRRGPDGLPEGALRLELEMVPKDCNYRLPQITPRPEVRGPGVAFVAAPDGSDVETVHTDEHGANGIGPGLYALTGKREQANEIRRVASVSALVLIRVALSCEKTSVTETTSSVPSLMIARRTLLVMLPLERRT